MLIDSNIIIYSALPENGHLRDLIKQHQPLVSVISYIEVLGYHLITAEDRENFEEFFEAAESLPITQEIIQQATVLRQSRKMSLADALIAATCLVHRLTLITRNTRDFLNIPNLTVIDPFFAEV